MKRLLISLAMTLIFLTPASLQAGDVCFGSELKEDLQAQLDTLDMDPLSALRAIIELAAGGLRDCSEASQTFSGLMGAQPVLSPLAVSEGWHIVTMTTDGSARIEGVALEGCGKDLDGVIHSFSGGQGIRGAANFVEVESDCTFYLEFSKITADWTLTIEQVQ